MDQKIDDIDVDLFGLLAQGDEAAFRQVVHFFYKKMLPVTISLVKSKLEAQGVLQEVFMKLWLNRGTLTTIENPAAWLNTILANTASNHIRSRLRYELKIKELTHQLSCDEPSVGDADVISTRKSLSEAVSQLPFKRKQIFLLSRQDGLTRKEIATQLNISENTVRNQLVQAIDFIRDYLIREGTLITTLAIFIQSGIQYYFYSA